MTQLSFVLPNVGEKGSVSDPKVTTALQQIQTWGNGNIDAGNVTDGTLTAAKLDAATVQVILGLTASGTTRRGKTNIATSESRTNTAYGTLTTPDQVVGIVLPTDGLIAVAYQATWQETVANAGKAAIFIGANQLKLADSAAPNNQAAVIQEASTGNPAATSFDIPLYSSSLGLVTKDFGGTGGGTSYTGDVTTGQVVGSSHGGGIAAGFYAGTNYRDGSVALAGPCYIFAAAGTYTISVQFKASSGTVTAKNRRLWCWTLGF